VAVKEAGQEMEAKAGGIWHEHIRAASEFTKDGKPQAFGDPFNAKLGEKWLGVTLKKLNERLAEMASADKVAVELAEQFT
jgi:hypothetical protein